MALVSPYLTLVPPLLPLPLIPLLYLMFYVFLP